MSLWDILPPEMQQHVLKFAIKQSPLVDIHDEIRKFYWEGPSFDWPMPRLRRLSEYNVVLKQHVNEFGITRYLRPIFRGSCGLNEDKTHYVANPSKIGCFLDITSWNVEKTYVLHKEYK